MIQKVGMMLYEPILKVYGESALKVTTMILDNREVDLIQLIIDEGYLHEKIEEAWTVLQRPTRKNLLL